MSKSLKDLADDLALTRRNIQRLKDMATEIEAEIIAQVNLGAKKSKTVHLVGMDLNVKTSSKKDIPYMDLIAIIAENKIQDPNKMPARLVFSASKLQEIKKQFPEIARLFEPKIIETQSKPTITIKEVEIET